MRETFCNFQQERLLHFAEIFEASANCVNKTCSGVTTRPLRYTGKYRYTGIGLKYRYRDF
jgi:hypothetical protein